MEHGQTNFEGLGQLKIHPRDAVEWLKSKPKREHLIPDSLRRFLQSGGGPTNSKAPIAPRPVTENMAERLAAEYIIGEQAAGRCPSLAGLEAAAKKAEMRGGGEFLRAAFRRSPLIESGAGVRLRRLRKSPKNNRRDFAD